MTAQPVLADPAVDSGPEGVPVRLPGYQLAPGYEVIEHVRRGEELDCYEAWSSQRYCRCFVKTLRPEAATDISARRSLQREARILLSLTHPHLVRAYEFLTPESGQPPLLVLENLTGATLSYLLDGGREQLGAEDLGYLGQHMCSALRYMHSQGYLHLDVKPSNIIANDGVGRLIDLSLARVPGRCSPGYGTPGYMSPEQASGGLLGPPADVWGLGLVLYYAATGIQPFDIPELDDSACSRTAILLACQAQLARPVPEIRARRGLPAGAVEIIEACLNPDPDRRPSLERLDATLGALTGAG